MTAQKNSAYSDAEEEFVYGNLSGVVSRKGAKARRKKRNYN
jgi:hypothetical protein